MSDGSSTEEAGPHHESNTSSIDNIQSVSNSSPKDVEQAQEKVEKSGPENQPQDRPSLSDFPQEQEGRHNLDSKNQPHDACVSGSEMHTEGNEEMVITSIRVTDIALGLRRLPASFYVVVHHSGREWRTENKSSLVNSGVVEWGEPIPTPSELSAVVCLEVYGSFEIQPMLDSKERLRKLTITVKQLLERSVGDVPFTLFPKAGDVVSPCSSILVTLNSRKCHSNDPSVSKVVDSHSSTANYRGELEEATNHGHTSLARYRKHGEKRDLERSIEYFERALIICPLGHPCLATVQSNLGMAKSIRCQVGNRHASLEIPLSLYRNALAARPVGHSDRPSTLIQMAAVHFARFWKERDGGERSQAEALLHEAIQLSPAESHENQAASFMLQLDAGHKVHPDQADGESSLGLASASHVMDEDPWDLSIWLLERFERFGDVVDLQQAIAILEKSVRSTSVWDGRARSGLMHLGVALWHRFNSLGEQSDLDGAISMLKDVVNMTPHGHPAKAAILNNLGISFYARFERFGELADLEDAILSHRDSVDLTPRGRPEKPTCLNNLSNALSARFERLGELADLEDSILALRDAVDLAHDSHPHKHSCLNNLGNSFLARFQRLGELSDLEDATSAFRNAINLTPHDHPNRPSRFNNFGNHFLTRFEHLGDLSDLGHAISNHRNAVDSTPRGHPGMHLYLNNLGNSVFTRFQHVGEPSDLEVAISSLGDSINLTPHDHPSMTARLHNLGIYFKARFECLGELSDLRHAISMLKKAVDLTPHGHPDKSGRLNDFGYSLFVRFERLGELNDLEDAILALREAIGLIPHGHPQKPNYLNSLGNFLVFRFEYFGELCDLEDAISSHRDAVDFTPDTQVNKPTYLSSLGNSFIARFKRLGELSDLEDSISMLRNAVDLAPEGHPRKPACLNSLGAAFLARFNRLGELSDLEDAISSLKIAIDSTAHGHPAMPMYLNSLGNCFVTRFNHIKELSDLSNAISSHMDAVALTPHGHPDKPMYLNCLGSSFFTRFRHLEQLSDLEVAISRYKDAVDLSPHGHIHKPGYQRNFGRAISTRFELLGELSDIEEAILALRDTVNVTPHGHPDKPACLISLGNCFLVRFVRLGELNDIHDAITLYSHAASAPKWIKCALRIRHPTLLHAYSVAIVLLPRLAWIGLSLTERYSRLKKGANVVREAAVAALDAGFPETAVEWLEQGRSIVWGELFQLRSSYEELASTHPHHACRLRELSAALDIAGAAREQSLSTLSEGTRRPGVAYDITQSMQQEVDKHRALAIERDKLLQEIRRLSGFEQFLLHKKFSQLRASAHSGPVIILNAAETRSDALIVLGDVDHVIHVPLPKFTFKRSEGLRNTLEKLLGHARVVPCGDRQGNPATWSGISWEVLLSVLWNGIVKPVLDALAFLTPGDLSRVFWCPTGPFTFLPIHAAGFYDPQHSQPGHKTSDFVISSYVPSLNILTLSSTPSVAASDDLRLLAVRQPPSDGQPHLKGVGIELEHIKAMIKRSPSARTNLLESSVGTVEDVLGLMKKADWVHFACHGIQDAADSGLCLADRRRLKLRDIIALSRPHGGLAFLSACQTAMGDEDLSDEAIHIAAGMLFAGYGGVIGTMWSISDKLAPQVARDVYEQLFRNGTKPDYREAAQALQDAIGRLRDSGNVSFVTWLPFIHVGL
ncbi:CHAT domain-containing protein [Boletus edulis BED1]|uniref:CHAT domain-containing protein n=1 Tax=Boletus edulis BED1 TaxID=1328754 RepID=A0AAD4GCL9_BOLED|nr:CHAT domain-containing protein [Boletus edulis BED1]